MCIQPLQVAAHFGKSVGNICLETDLTCVQPCEDREPCETVSACLLQQGGHVQH